MGRTAPESHKARTGAANKATDVPGQVPEPDANTGDGDDSTEEE